MDHPNDVEKLARLVCPHPRFRLRPQGRQGPPLPQKDRRRINYKAIERLKEGLEPERLLHRLIDPGTPFVPKVCPLGVPVDPTEIPRPRAARTPYGGRLGEGRLGFTAFLMAQPYQGRAIPVYMGVYS